MTESGMRESWLQAALRRFMPQVILLNVHPAKPAEDRFG